jgi:hypothetical protein
MARIVLEDKILNEDLVNAPWTQSRLLKIQDPESRYFYHNMTKATVGWLLERTEFSPLP